MDTAEILTGAELRVLKTYRNRWVAGWALAGTAALFSAYQLGLRLEADRHREELQQTLKQVADLQDRQRQLTAHFVTAWENQQQTADLLVTWGSYVRARTEAAQKNVGLPSQGFRYARTP